MANTTGMFHVRNGLFFFRQEDGGVHLVKKEGFDGPVLFEAVIDRDSWLSIVAFVSKSGATPETLQLVADMHGER